MKNLPPIPQVLISLFCAWRCWDLVIFWKTAPNSEYFGWVIFLLWLLPLFLSRRTSAATEPFLPFVALGFATLGMLGDFNILEHIGLSFAVVSLVPWNRFSLIWLLSALSWMPAFTWFAAYIALDYAFLGRCILVTATLVIYFLLKRRPITAEAP